MIQNDRVLKDMSIGDVLDYSIYIYKKNFKKLTLLSLIFFVPFMLIYAGVVNVVSSEFVSFTTGNTGMGNMSEYVYSMLAYYGVLSVMGIVYFIYSFTIKAVFESAIVKVVYDKVIHNREHSIKSLTKESFKKFPALMINKLLSGLIIFGLGIGWLIVFYILLFLVVLGTLLGVNSGLGSGLNIMLAVVLGVIGLAVLIAASLFFAYIAVKYSLGIPAVTVENKSGIGALSRSSELTRKNFWHVALVFLFGYLLLFTIPQILSASSYFLIYINRSWYVLSTVSTQVINSLIYPFIITMMTVLFISLKIKKEGLDLEVKVDMLLEEQQNQAQGENGDTVNG